MNQGGGYGLTISKVEKLISDIKTSYKTIGTHITQNWPTVVQSLRDNWVGVDEQDFESKIVDRENLLYENVRIILNRAMATVHAAGESYIETMKRNTLSGETVQDVSGITLKELVLIPASDAIVTFSKMTLTADLTLGLQNANSATSIQSVIDTYLSGLKTVIDTIEGELLAQTVAFSGTQVKTTLDSYFNSLSTSMNGLISAVKDMYEALGIVAGSVYSQLESSISSEIGSEKSEMETQVESAMGSAKWQ